MSFARLAVLRSRDLRQIGRDVGDLVACGLGEILRLGNVGQRHDVRRAAGVGVIDAVRDRRVELAAFQQLIVGVAHCALFQHQGAIGCVLLPAARKLGAVLDADGDALRAQTVAISDGGAVAFLQHGIAVVVDGLRCLEGDLRFLAQRTRGGDAGDLLHVLQCAGAGGLRGVVAGFL